MARVISLKSIFSSLRKWQVVALIVFAALLLHLWSAWQLPLDADEPAYMNAAKDYSNLIRSGNWRGVVEYRGNLEHPALVKLLYAVPFFFTTDYETAYYINRLQSVVLGTLSVFLLALFDPLAGLFLAFHSMFLKYTSEVYLEALPFLGALGAVLAFVRAQKNNNKVFYILAAFGLGIAGAGKITYLLAAFVVLVLAFWRRKPDWTAMLAFSGLAIIFWFLLSPGLWADPIGRLKEILGFHLTYTQSSEVQRLDYPWYQPLLWVFNSVPWHPQVFFFVTSDGLAAIMALLGLFRESRRRPWLVFWLAGGMVFLLIWPTKWPQYSLLLTAAVCLVGADMARWIFEKLRTSNAYWEWAREILPDPHPSFWIALVLFFGALGAGKVAYEYDMALSRRGWSFYTSDFAPLPAGNVNAIFFSQDGTAAIGTDHGVQFWKPNKSSPWGEHPAPPALTKENVHAVFQDERAVWWVGTDRGVMRLDGQEWTEFGSREIGLSDVRVRALTGDREGHIWAGTLGGAAVWNGKSWQSYPIDPRGLPAGPVFSILAPSGLGEVWFGTLKGVTRYNEETLSWDTTQLGDGRPGWGGVTDLVYDSNGRVWAATQGAGVSSWLPSGWTNYQVDNSNIPQNNVESLVESSPGVFWLGLTYSTEPGGFLARFDGKNWQNYTIHNSGYLGAEPLTMALGPDGQIWIGTATGLQIYQFR